MKFPNKAGDHVDIDNILEAELYRAGINAEKHNWLRTGSGEVKTSVIGTLHGWSFTRAWYYWVCEGPGIEGDIAEKLFNSHGKTVRTGGYYAYSNPRDYYKGSACGLYHVDDDEGLKALTDTIKFIYNKSKILESLRESEKLIIQGEQ